MHCEFRFFSLNFSAMCDLVLGWLICWFVAELGVACGGLVAGLVSRVVGLSFRRILFGMGLSVSLQTVLKK